MTETLKKSKKGFTLVELIVVVVILGVLMAVLVPQYIQYVDRSRQGVDLNALGEVYHAVELENALTEAASGTILISGTAGSKLEISGTSPVVSKVKVVIEDGITLTSKAGAQVSYMAITIDADGNIEWDTNSQALMTKLEAGTAAAEDGAACVGS